MGLVERVQRWIRGSEPTFVDYEAYEQVLPPGSAQPPASVPGLLPADQGFMGDSSSVLGRVGVASGALSPTPPPPISGSANPAGTYKIQQSYDALLQTVQELRAALDGQSRRQEELFERLSTLPAAAEALPQTSKMQADMLKLINDRLSMHADQQRKVQEVVNQVGGTGPGAAAVKKEYGEALQSIREQIEMGNEIDRQLVESFNRFSMMIDRLQLANQHAVDALQQVRDSYAASAMQMHEWIEKSRQRNGWLIGGAFMMAAGALAISFILLLKMGTAR
jgi:hypothetical protein